MRLYDVPCGKRKYSNAQARRLDRCAEAAQNAGMRHNNTSTTGTRHEHGMSGRLIPHLALGHHKTLAWAASAIAAILGDPTRTISHPRTGSLALFRQPPHS